MPVIAMTMPIPTRIRDERRHATHISKIPTKDTSAQQMLFIISLGRSRKYAKTSFSSFFFFIIKN